MSHSQQREQGYGRGDWVADEDNREAHQRYHVGFLPVGYVEQMSAERPYQQCAYGVACQHESDFGSVALERVNQVQRQYRDQRIQRDLIEKICDTSGYVASCE